MQIMATLMDGIQSRRDLHMVSEGPEPYAAEYNASGKGMQWTNLVVRHIAVSKNFIP